MRKPLLTVTAVALVVAACSGSTSSAPSDGYVPPEPQHHRPTPEPWPDRP